MNTSDNTPTSIADFEKEIERQEDIVYGVALFFECLHIIHADKEAIVETCRKQLRNVIQKGNERAKHARQLLEDAKKDPEKCALIRRFTFAPCEGYQSPEIMTKRAESLVNAYNRIFPKRPRSQDFTDEEVFLLIEEASLSFE